MKRIGLAFGVAAMILAAVPRLQAATAAGMDDRDALIVQERVKNPSVGAAYERLLRDVRYDGGEKTRLEANTGCGYVGYDVTPWAVVFGTIGATTAQSTELEESGDARVKWSAGVKLNLWRLDIEDPAFLGGRCTLRAQGEFARYESGNLDPASFDWTEWYATLTLNYELFARKRSDYNRVPYSLMLYAGPALSRIDGTRETSGGSRDFEGDNVFGLCAGADLFIAHNLSAGAQLQHYFDEPTLSASLIYHF